MSTYVSLIAFLLTVWIIPKIYNPPQLDVAGWGVAFKEAGMQCALLTTRHTSNFLLWDSATTEIDVAQSGNTTDACREFVKECRRLPVKIRFASNLSGTAITDAGLKNLQGLKWLHILNLNHTGVTDASLEHLKGSARLNSLNLAGTKVTKAGKSKLQKSLPNLNFNQRNGPFPNIPGTVIDASTPD